MLKPSVTLLCPKVDDESEWVRVVDCTEFDLSDEFEFVRQHGKDLYEGFDGWSVMSIMLGQVFTVDKLEEIDTELSKLADYWKMDGSNPRFADAFPKGISFENVRIFWGEIGEGNLDSDEPSLENLSFALKKGSGACCPFGGISQFQWKIILLLCDFWQLLDDNCFTPALTVEGVDLALTHEDVFVGVVTNRSNYFETGEPNWKKIEKAIRGKLGSFDRNLTQAMMLRMEGARSIGQRETSSEIGIAFEREVAQLFSVMGFDVSHTQETGDFGVDLILSIGEKKVAVQTKKYTKPVGVQAVQEVAAGMAHYGCDQAIVVSNVAYTVAAEALARSTGVKLFNIDTLRFKLRDYFSRIVL